MTRLAPDSSAGPVPRALVLVAGMGLRLRPETLDRPKCLVDIGGTPLLLGLLSGLAAAGVVDVTLVVGYRGAMIRSAVARWALARPQVSWLENPGFAWTNTLSSVAVAADGLRGRSFLLLNGDLWIRPDELGRLVAGPDRLAMLVDPTVEMDGEAMRVAFDEAGRVSAVGKTLPRETAHGEAIGAYRFDADTSGLFFDAVCSRQSQGDTTSFYEAALDQLLRDGTRAEAIAVDPLAWVEVDDRYDLERAAARAASDASPALRSARRGVRDLA
jgi:choline kinase